MTFDLIKAIDLGLSSTKSIAWLPDSNILDFNISAPEVVDGLDKDLVKDEARLNQTISIGGKAKPLEAAWIRVGKRAAAPAAVGTLARAFSADRDYEIPKAQRAVERIVASIGATAVKYNLPDKFTLDLSCVIPFDEFIDSEKLEREVTDALKNFYFQERHYKIKLSSQADNFSCYPEGYGMALAYGKEYVASHNLAVIMMGHRNTSVLCFAGGSLDRSISTTELVGFRDFVESICARVSALHESPRFIEALFDAGNDYEAADFTSVAFSISKDSEAALEKSQEIKEAIPVARKLYARKLEKLLKNSLSQFPFDQIVLAGGASKYFIPELRAYFSENWGGDIENYMNWNDELKTSFLRAFQDRKTLDISATRMLDIWGVFSNVSGFNLR